MLLIYIIGCLSLTFFSCVSHAYNIPSEIGRIVHSEQQIDTAMRIDILKQYQKWQGTRYFFGGNTLDGVDCSALMQHIFRDMKNLYLPRTTTGQIRKGIKIGRHNMKPGDLVFFRSGQTQHHVGVYIGSDEFIHASVSQGVTISSLDNQYWNKRFLTARRITA